MLSLFDDDDDDDDDSKLINENELHTGSVVPRANTDRFSRCGFSVCGPNQWKKLPPHIRKVSDKPEQFA